jgi:hypothetical protein
MAQTCAAGQTTQAEQELLAARRERLRRLHVERGEIEVERENGMIELEIKADGRQANVKLPDVPSAIGTSGSVKDREVELPYVVRKLDVKSAKSLAPSCQ